ncbi:MAG TPA: MBL fold metallo-hydrolase, partial [Kribbella sp.]
MTSLTVTRIGHACQLIEIGDRRILTDPWFTQTATYYQGERILPLIGPGTVATLAKDKGFRDVRAIEAWDATVVDDVTVTAAPGKHGVHEITFVIQSGGRTVYFGGDSLRVPELDTIPER